MTTYRDFKMTRREFRPSSHHYHNLYDKVYDYVLHFKITPKNYYIRKEVIAEKFRVKVSEVEHILHQLNLLGLVSQPVHRAPHDSKREPGGYETSTWAADIYYPKNIEYVLKKLNEGNVFDPERYEMTKIIASNNDAIISAFKGKTKLTEEEKRYLLKQGLQLNIVCGSLFEEYAKTEWREEAFQKVLNDTEFCFNSIANGILTEKERKKAFKVILNDETDRFKGYQAYRIPFFLSKMICEVKLLKSEKETIIHKALKEKNGELALLLVNFNQELKVDKYLQDKLEAFAVMYKLEKEG